MNLYTEKSNISPKTLIKKINGDKYKFFSTFSNFFKFFENKMLSKQYFNLFLKKENINIKDNNLINSLILYPNYLNENDCKIEILNETFIHFDKICIKITDNNKLYILDTNDSKTFLNIIYKKINFL